MSKQLTVTLMFLWLAFIWCVSSLPAAVLPKTDFLKFDKLLHFGVYLVLSILVFINQRKGFFGSMRSWDILFLFSMSAALEEAHQTFVSNRQVSALDLAANLLGIFLGYFIITRIVYRHNMDSRLHGNDGNGNDRAKKA